MLHCPFCDAELDTDSLRVRGGRCPSCGSILNWSESEPEPVAPAEASGGHTGPSASTAPPQPPSPPARAPVGDDDNLSMRDIVRTLVQRGSQEPAPRDHRPTLVTPLAPPMSPPAPASGPPSTVPPAGEPFAPEAIDNLWKGTLTVRANPLMTLKAASAAPDPAVSELLIRTHRVRFPDEHDQVQAEYELEETIGEGGVGVVYAARQSSIDRTVALKMLKQEFAHQTDHRQKFLSEAVVTGELDHPNIVPIYDLGTSDLGTLFYAMKRVRGTPWSDVIRSKSQAENLRILLSVADAIAFAHARGVIHRDLKPENVMLGDYGEVLVMDWGIALSTATYVKSGRISQSTSMGGTPAYMAPEMATGPLDKIGPASDVYLLGAILYEIVAGQPPHTGKDVMSCLYAAARNEIQPTSETGELVEIARRAMATRPEDRYADVQAFQAAVRTYQSHSESIVLSARADEELAAARQSRDYQDYSRSLFAYQEAHTLWAENQRARAGEIEARMAYARCALEKGDFDLGLSLLDPREKKWAPLRGELSRAQAERDARQSRLRNLRNLAVALAATIFLVVTAGLVVIWRTNQDLRQTTLDLVKGERKLARNERKVRMNSFQLVLANLDLASQKKVAEKARDLAFVLTNEAERSQQQALAASYLAQIGVGAERVANNSFVDASELLQRYDRDTPYYRNWEWAHLTYLCGLSADEALVAGRIECLAGSRDGSLVAAGTSAGEIFLWTIDFSRPEVRFEALPPLPVGSPLSALALAGDGSWLASAADADQGAIQIWRRQEDGSFAKDRLLSGHKDRVVALAVAPSGQQLVSGSLDESARLWDVARGEVVEAYFGHFGPVWGVACAGDGAVREVVTGGDDGTVRVWSVGTPGQARCIYRGHTGPVFAVAVSPSQQEVASAGRDKTVQVWEPAKVRPFDFDELGTRIRSAGLTPASRVGDLPRQLPVPEHRLLVGHTAEIRAVEFSADGQRVLSAGNDNTVKLWDYRQPSSPDYVRTFRGHGGWVRGCLLSASGRYAVSGGHDGQLRLWDTATYEEVGELRDHTDAVLWASFARDGRRMVTAGRDRQALLWNFQGRREPIQALTDDPPTADGAEPIVHLQEGHEFLVTAAAQFPAGDSRLLTSAGDNSVRMWDMRFGGQMRRLDGTGTISVVALSEDGRWIVTGSQGKNAQLWSADDAEAAPLQLVGHAGEVSAAAIAPGGDGSLASLRLTTGDVAGGVRQWHYDSEQKQFVSTELRGHEPGYVIVAVRYAAGGERIITASQDHSVLQWDAATGRQIPGSILRHPKSIRGLDISPDGGRAVTLCETNPGQFRVYLWDLARAEAETCDLNVPGQTFTSAAFAHGGNAVLLVSSRDDASQLWQWQIGTPTAAPLWPDHVVRALVWAAYPTRDGAGILAVGGSQARLLDAQTGQQRRTFSPHGAVTCANFSPGGERVATSSIDGDVKLWITDPADPRYGKVALKIMGAHAVQGINYPVNFAAFSPRTEGAALLLATAGDDGLVKLFRIENDQTTGERIFAGHTKRVRSVQFSPDGQWLLSASDDGDACIWSVAEGTKVAALSHDRSAVLFASFAPDGQRIITGCDDNNARVWDCRQPDQAKLLFMLEGHTAGVTSAAISPDGRRAITGSQDGMAKIWDVEAEDASQPREILSLKRHTAEVTSTHFSPDGRSILTSSHDRTALVWLSVDIGPSLKFSRSMIAASRSTEPQAIDLHAEIRDPDAYLIERAHLTVAATKPQSGPAVELALVPVAGLVLEGNTLRRAGAAETVPPLAIIESQAGGLRLELTEDCTLSEAQDVVRSIGWRSAAPLTAEVEVAFTLEYGTSGESARASVKIVPVAQEADPLTVERSEPALRTAKRTAASSVRGPALQPTGP
jgi:WD40 repeat protein/serine/threonine protein kinase